jgi:hypothetical protein
MGMLPKRQSQSSRVVWYQAAKTGCVANVTGAVTSSAAFDSVPLAKEVARRVSRSPPRKPMSWNLHKTPILESWLPVASLDTSTWLVRVASLCRNTIRHVCPSDNRNIDQCISILIALDGRSLSPPGLRLNSVRFALSATASWKASSSGS